MKLNRYDLNSIITQAAKRFPVAPLRHDKERCVVGGEDRGSLLKMDATAECRLNSLSRNAGPPFDATPGGAQNPRKVKGRPREVFVSNLGVSGP